MLQLVTKNKTVSLVFKTRKLVNITNKLGGKNFEDIFFKAMSSLDLDVLSKIIYEFSEMIEGQNAFKSSDEVYDFIDDYKAESDKTYKDIFKEIAEAINKEGFFNSKMKEKEILDKISNPLLQMNLEDITKSSVEKAITKVASAQIAAQV